MTRGFTGQPNIQAYSVMISRKLGDCRRDFWRDFSLSVIFCSYPSHHNRPPQSMETSYTLDSATLRRHGVIKPEGGLGELKAQQYVQHS
jgi:hypothetical protein